MINKLANFIGYVRSYLPGRSPQKRTLDEVYSSDNIQDLYHSRRIKYDDSEFKLTTEIKENFSVGKNSKVTFKNDIEDNNHKNSTYKEDSKIKRNSTESCK